MFFKCTFYASEGGFFYSFDRFSKGVEIRRNV
jgi:hypothetical protein